ncbi:MAG: thiamine-phosphate synthase family protein [Methanobacterium sp.]|nr:thiamine-phosphate synthase family protein [Methanobacterium sp.]
MEKKDVQKAVRILESSPEFTAIIPEVRSNIVMAMENAETINQVVGIPGRITIVNGMPKATMDPDFMTSSHMARLVISVIKHNPSKRSAINIKYDPIILEVCRKLGLEISSYDRVHEPDKVKEREGSTIPWGVETAIEKSGKVPDIIYHKGAWGKEPMICLLGSRACEVAEIVVCIAKLTEIRKKEGLLIPEKVIEPPRDCHDVLFATTRKSWDNKKDEVPCVFCAIAEGNPKVKEMVLYNDKENMVLMNIFPYNRGHLEVVPVKHFTDLNELNLEEMGKLFYLVQKSMSLIREVIKPDGINIGINLGKTAGSSIKHLHIHIVPRFKYESGFMETIADTRIIEEDIDITYNKFIEEIEILKR